MTYPSNEQGRILQRYLTRWDYISLVSRSCQLDRSPNGLHVRHGSTSTIDHILCPSIRVDNLTSSCAILPDHPLNLSDHLPITTSLSLLLSSSGISASSDVSAQASRKPSWKKCSDDQISHYGQLVLDSLPGISQSTTWTEQDMSYVR